jgi:hypothetical protein
LERFVRANTQVIVDYDFQAQMGRERARGGVERAVCELAANIMRVIDGSGRPEMIGPQAQALVFAMDAHRTIAGNALSGDEIAAVLSVVAKETRGERLPLDRRPELKATPGAWVRPSDGRVSP